MKTIELTKGYVALISDDDASLVSQYKWHASAKREGSVYAYTARLPMHRLIVSAPKGSVVDHINGDTLDNQRTNLRLVDTSQNQQNRGPNKNNKSGYKGVSRAFEGYWQAHIWASGTHYSLGVFALAEDAARAYDLAARRLHGEYAYLNFGPK